MGVNIFCNSGLVVQRIIHNVFIYVALLPSLIHSRLSAHTNYITEHVFPVFSKRDVNVSISEKKESHFQNYPQRFKRILCQNKLKHTRTDLQI